MKFVERLWHGTQTVFAIRTCTLVDVWLGLIGGLVGFVVCGRVAEWAMKLFPNFSHDNLNEMNQMISSSEGISSVVILIALGVIVPIIEELFFRGFLWRGFEKIFNPTWVRVICVALIFSIAHGEVPHIIGVFPLALFLSWLRLRSNSIWPGMITHIVNNTLSVLILLSGTT